ncbi:MAG: polysaccharide pyruvyl transferase CsaB [Negativicutes bacterium]|nr:polysaccharide pyruvyl transferase CsaB [Negativicutes bacterium]
MSEIVVSGYYGFANAGDEAMLAAMIEALTEVDPAVKITVISGNPADTRQRHGVAAVYRLNYPEIIRVLSQSDLLVSGGGSLLQDVTSDRSLYYYLSIMMLAKKLGKPVMLYAQGIGPVRGALAKGAMRYIGNMVDLITVRDDGSREELKALGVKIPPVYVTADPVLALHPVDKEVGRSILRKHNLGGATPLIGLSAREWKDWGYFKQVLGQSMDELAEEFGARVVFIPMQWPEDLEVARKIKSRMRQSAVLLEEQYTTSELLSLVANLDMLIGIRLHALIFATVMHVPLVGISYDPKVDRFLETLGARHAGTLQNITVEELKAKVRELWPQIGRPNKEREERINVLRGKAFSNAELAMGLIEERKRG